MFRKTSSLSLVFTALVLSMGCGQDAAAPQAPPPTQKQAAPVQKEPRQPRAFKVVHVFVALCDNKNQGIVPVPAKLGNGQDPANNLYWGARYGVKTFFKSAPGWSPVELSAPTVDGILERAAFKSRIGNEDIYLVAEAYDGARMKEALSAFFNVAAGRIVTEFESVEPSKRVKLECGGYADLVCFVGHNGLMDVPWTDGPTKEGAENPAGAVVLACKSREYFSRGLEKARCAPLVTTTNLMAPEAYTLETIVRSWASGDAPKVIRQKAGATYAHYQGISIAAGERLFSVTR